MTINIIPTPTPTPTAEKETEKEIGGKMEVVVLLVDGLVELLGIGGVSK